MGSVTYFLLIICVCLKCDITSAQGKYTNESLVSFKKHPYIAHVKTASSHCGGSILNRRYILTAAHCVWGAKKITIRIGSRFVYTGGLTYTSDEYWVYERNPHVDVALVKVSQRMNLESAGATPVRLIGSGQTIKRATNITVIGWGHMDGEGRKPSYLVGATSVLSYSNFKCRSVIGKEFTLIYFCSGIKVDEKGPCKGDSGSPAVAKGVQIGVASFLNVKGCGVPATYVNITHPPIRRWIKNITGI